MPNHSIEHQLQAKRDSFQQDKNWCFGNDISVSQHKMFKFKRFIFQNLYEKRPFTLYCIELGLSLQLISELFRVIMD